jgi:hypothetical protein
MMVFSLRNINRRGSHQFKPGYAVQISGAQRLEASKLLEGFDGKKYKMLLAIKIDGRFLNSKEGKGE